MKSGRERMEWSVAEAARKAAASQEGHCGQDQCGQEVLDPEEQLSESRSIVAPRFESNTDPRRG